ncbi:cytochrome oxidase subunit III [Hylemonella gracilis str. Niagara R]|uniref:Cbb3-type cytochrome c oxidase subunit n=1 Tax=Hylemonella gracilis str. Niagara R TaxID=1458275 RepID=A0A016XHX3_9BURK|nr:cytochrome-c oxidase, cbb3-type subunit III [Hylemonella gracilis]EYC51142.1 cytochrome oxidase subunit III [Hylemonella gracilis str. Niagara R]
MSDFTHNYWSIFIGAVTLISIIACLVLLWVSGKVKVKNASADNSTGHVWDEDLREMNNPLPRWWVGLFILTIIFSLVYLFLYPGLGKHEGSLGWTQLGEYEAEMAKGAQQVAPLYARFAGLSVPDTSKDGQALTMGEKLFLNNCAQCHGSDARGSKGFPNLTDGDWLWGGTPDEIKTSITQGRAGVMPPMAAAVGGADDVKNVAHYVLSLSNSPHDSLRAQLGKAKFGVCAACHGQDGKGNPLLGAPNLTDDVWLHGWGESAITAMINAGKTNQMPAQGTAHGGKLSPEQIHLLTAYVWSRGGGR